MLILGRSDRLDLPGLGLSAIHTSSLHCSGTKVVNGNLEFVLLDEEHPEFTGMKFTFKKYTQREIKNSSGEAELRYIIKTTVRIYGKVYRTEFSLSNRGSLKFPVLLGRRVLRKRFLIDVSQTNLSFKNNATFSNTSNP